MLRFVVSIVGFLIYVPPALAVDLTCAQARLVGIGDYARPGRLQSSGTAPTEREAMHRRNGRSIVLASGFGRADG